MSLHISRCNGGIFFCVKRREATATRATSKTTANIALTQTYTHNRLFIFIILIHLHTHLSPFFFASFLFCGHVLFLIRFPCHQVAAANRLPSRYKNFIKLRMQRKKRKKYALLPMQKWVVVRLPYLAISCTCCHVMALGSASLSKYIYFSILLRLSLLPHLQVSLWLCAAANIVESN